LGYRQIKLSPKDYLDGVSNCGVSLEYTFMSFGLTNTFALFLQHMSPLSWSIQISLLLSPSMTFLFLPVEDIHIGYLALMLETFENHLCVIMKYEFWMLEVTFSP
jgi:hypothetical protein